MATRGYSSVASATQTNNTSATTWTTQTSATFNLDASSTYLVLAYCEANVNNANSADVKLRLWDGTTALCSVNREVIGTDGAEWPGHDLCAIITTTSAVTPTLSLQHQVESTAASRQSQARNAVIVALKLGANDVSMSNDTAGTSVSNPGAFTDYAPGSGTTTLTFTPPSTGDYLILAFCLRSFNATANGARVALLCEDGTTRVANTPWVPSDSTTKESWCCAVKRTGLTAVSQVFKLQHARMTSGSGTSTIESVRMVALRLSDFDSSNSTEDTTQRTTTSATYVDVTTTQTDTLANTVDYLLLGDWWANTANNAVLHSTTLTDGTNTYAENQAKENFHAAEASEGVNIVVPRVVTGTGASVTHKLQAKVASGVTLNVDYHRFHVLQLVAVATGITGSGSTAGTSSTSATAVVAHKASASTAGSSTTSATGKTAHTGSGSTAGSSSTSATGTVAHKATASTTGSSTTAATGKVSHTATATTAGTSSTSATAKVAHTASASTAGTSTTSATGRTAHAATGSTTGASSATATGSVARKKTETLTDRFNTAINAPPWNYSNLVTVVGGRARFEVRSDYSSTMNTGSTVYSLLDSHLFAQAFPDTGNTTRQLILQALDGNSVSAIQIAKSGTSLVLENTGSNPHADYVTFDATAHAWWQLRADTTNVYWETSPDGSTWTTRRTTSFATLGWTPAEVKPAVTVGYWGTETTPFTVEIDNVNTVVTAHQASGSTTGSSSTSAVAAVSHKATASTAGSSTSAATAKVAHHATASTTGTSTATAAGTVVHSGVVSGSTSGSSSTACTARVAHTGAGSSGGSSSAVCTAKVIRRGVAIVGGSSSATATAKVAHYASGTTGGTSSTFARASGVLVHGTGSTSGSSSATATGKLTKYGVALTIGTSTAVASGLVEAVPQVAHGAVVASVIDNGVAASVVANDVVCEVVQAELLSEVSP